MKSVNNEKFCFKTVPGKGVCVFATQPMAPGTVLVVEPPIFLMTEQFKQKYAETSGVTSQLILHGALYSCWQKSSEINKTKYMNLYGPTDCFEFNRMKVGLKMGHDGTQSRKVIDSEVEKFVKVISIYKYNSFQVGESEDIGVYEFTSRMSHSCLPNCIVRFVGHNCVCRVILPVAAGEELTLEYNAVTRNKPTHMRRNNYLTYKEFTCHCPRCDNPADDTRQFPCFDAECSGKIFACQPLNKDGFATLNEVAYDMMFVKPCLLPCTLCRREPPHHYQMEMFLLEAALPAIFADLDLEVHNEMVQPISAATKHNTNALLEHIDAVKCPPMHQLANKIRKLSCIVLRRQLAMDRSPEVCQRFLEALIRYAMPFEEIAQFPNDTTMHAFFFVCSEGITLGSMEGLQLAKKYGQKALRIHMLIHGSSLRRKEYDDKLCYVLYQINLSMPAGAAALAAKSVETESMCGFCEESEEFACITLLRCSRCQVTSYCSLGCKRAHWKVHKIVCKKFKA